MMILSMQGQGTLFLLTIFMGFVIGGVYDGLRIFRKVIPHPKSLISLEDGIYWVAVVFFIFTIMLKKNNGEIRVFSLMGVFLGMGFYFLLLSPIVQGVSDVVISVISWILRLVRDVIFMPFRVVWFILRRPVLKVYNFFHKKWKNLLHSGKVYAKIKRRAVKRDLSVLFRKK